MSKSEETGLSRWSRRKARARFHKRGAALPAPASAAPEAAPADIVREDQSTAPSGSTGEAQTDSASVSPETTMTEPAGDAPSDLPPVEDLDYDSDYAPFLSPDVSDSVRKLALRRLWRSNPILANVDGLVDYDDDFTDAATVIEGLKSVYQVGRGMLVEEDDEKAAEEDVVEVESDEDTADADVASAQSAEDKPDELPDAGAADAPVDSQNERDTAISQTENPETQTKPSKREV